MRLTLAAVLMMCITNSAFAKAAVPAALLGNTKAVESYIEKGEKVSSKQVRFRMSMLGSRGSIPLSATVFGSVSSTDLADITSAIELSNVAFDMDGPWRLTVKGNARSAKVVVEPIYRCSKSIGQLWILSNAEDRWRVIEQRPGKIWPPCEPTP